MKKLGLLDSAWLLLEAPETPMHVGVLLQFAPPAGASPDFIYQVVASLRGSTGAASPWDLILPIQKLRGLIPLWFHECYLDMEHHVRLYALSGDDQERIAELENGVSVLHGQALDKSRPLWECHVFNGLPDGQFALYLKVHHALLDGVGGIRMMQDMLAQSPEERNKASPWVTQVKTSARPRRRSAARRNAASVRPGVDKGVNKPESGKDNTLPKNAGMVSHLMRATGEMVRAARDRADQLVTPFLAPSARFNRRITASRAHITETCDMSRIKRLAQLSGASCNDVVLAICAGALRRFLVGLDIPPSSRLTAAVPVSTRSRHGTNTGTALSFYLANLGTDIPNARERLAAINASTQRAKEYMGRLPRAAWMPYTTMLMLPFIAGHFSKTMSRVRPMFNIVISNVPGPKAPLYLEGAELVSASPLSVLFHGQALNITCIRYLDKFSFGFTGCPDVLPGIEELPAYTRAALQELEKEFSFPHQQGESRKARSRSKKGDSVSVASN